MSDLQTSLQLIKALGEHLDLMQTTFGADVESTDELQSLIDVQQRLAEQLTVQLPSPLPAALAEPVRQLQVQTDELMQKLSKLRQTTGEAATQFHQQKKAHSAYQSMSKPVRR